MPDFEFVIRYPSGNQVRKNAWGYTRAEALAYLRQLQRENAGTPNAFEIVGEVEEADGYQSAPQAHLP